MEQRRPADNPRVSFRVLALQLVTALVTACTSAPLVVPENNRDASRPLAKVAPPSVTADTSASAVPAESKPPTSLEATSSAVPPRDPPNSKEAPVVCRMDAGSRAQSANDAQPQGPSSAPTPVPAQQGLQVSGRVPPEMIREPIRRHYGCFRKCYEQGLVTSPNLVGAVNVSFMIENHTGKVIHAQDARSTLPNAQVVACVVNEVRGVRFPAPERGNITVTYPLMFTAGE